MKQRILDYLSVLGTGEQSAVQQTLLAKTGLTPLELQMRSQEVLANILHQYSFFSIATIDSFFQLVIRTFSRELGIHSGISLELDQEKVLSEIVQTLIESLEPDSRLMRWLTQFSSGQVEAG